MLIISKAKN